MRSPWMRSSSACCDGAGLFEARGAGVGQGTIAVPPHGYGAGMSHDDSVTNEGREGPLAGVRVLDLTRVLSGPHCTRMLCDLGAEVIKVEPPGGDMTRFANPRINGLASYFVQQNSGKRNISLNMAHPDALELLLGLAERCDVLVENFRPGVMDRMGLGYAVVVRRNPRIVFASIS